MLTCSSFSCKLMSVFPHQFALSPRYLIYHLFLAFFQLFYLLPITIFKTFPLHFFPSSCHFPHPIGKSCFFICHLPPLSISFSNIPQSSPPTPGLIHASSRECKAQAGEDEPKQVANTALTRIPPVRTGLVPPPAGRSPLPLLKHGSSYLAAKVPMLGSPCYLCCLRRAQDLPPAPL